jgi:hypothetical protein
MLLSLDNVAQRYGVLPSVALQQGNTIDLLVLHTASKYNEWTQTDEYKQNKGRTTKALQKMLEGVKRAKNKRQDKSVVG